MALLDSERSAERTKSGLLRVLGVSFGLAVAVGAMVGSGIFRTPGAVFGHVPVFWLAMMLWGCGALHVLIAANIWCEVATSIPETGGIFVFVRRAFGDGMAMLSGWIDFLQGIAAVAALGVAAGEFLGVLVPGLSLHPGMAASLLILLVALINWGGISFGEGAQLALSLAKTAAIAMLILAIFLFMPSGGAEASNPVASAAPVVGLTAIVISYQLVYGAYLGWNAPVYFNEETQDPGRAIPRAMLFSILGVAALYLLMNGALWYSLPLDRLAGSAFPAGAAMDGLLGAKSAKVMAAIAFVTVLGALNATFMPSIRVLLGLGRDGFMPRVFAHVNRRGTPDAALVLMTAVVIALAVTGRFEMIFLWTGALGLMMSVFCDLAYFQLRRKEPDLARPFRAIAHPWLPLLALLLDAGVVLLVIFADPLSAVIIGGAIALCWPLNRIARRRAAKTAG